VLGATVNRMQGSTPLESRREYKIAAGLNLSDDDQPWTPDTQRKYDKFIEDERKYVSEGRWEQFPYGSRLFVGNLSSERVTKRDIFHAFHRYGDLAQISIKQAYGFVQFLRPQDCSVALAREEGRQIRGKKIRKCTICGLSVLLLIFDHRPRSQQTPA
jgi:nuclear polyadenylated RNA-binding protein 3